MAIAPVRQQINKNTREEKYIQYVQGAAEYIKRNCRVVTLTGEAIRSYTLPKSDLGATTAKRQVLYISRHINLVASCSFKS